MSIVILPHLGPSTPLYLADCVHQIRLWNVDTCIIVVLDSVHRNAPFWKTLQSDYQVIYQYTDELVPSNAHKAFLTKNTCDTTFRQGYWRYVVERFFYVEEVMRALDLKHCIVLEYDVMVYTDLGVLTNKLKTSHQTCRVVCDNSTRCYPSCIYVPNADAIGRLNTFVEVHCASGLTDMELLAKYGKDHPEDLHYLPVITKERNRSVNPRRAFNGHTESDPWYLSEDADHMGVLFDSLVVGQYLGGVDPRNNGGQKSGPYLNESALYSMREMPFEWKHVGGRWQPFVDHRPLAIIHVHCKSLKSFRSDRPTRPINDYQVDDLLPALVPNTGISQIKAIYFRYKSPENYYHWLIYMVSNLRHIDTSQIQRVYIQHLHPGLVGKSNSYIFETLKILLPALQSVHGVPQCPEGAIELEYCPNPDTIKEGEPHQKEAYMFLKDRLLPHIVTQRGTFPKHIYISRARATKRKILNESDLITHLRAFGVHVLYLEDLGGLEQMAYFYNADLIITPHGAALANMVFCKESTRIIEICSKEMTRLRYFEHIGIVMNLKYMRFQEVIPDSDHINANMTVKLEYFKLLEQAITCVPSHCPTARSCP